MHRVIVITGTPGIGKTTISKKLKQRIKGSLLIETTDLINRRRLYTSIAKDGTKVVNLPALKREIEKEIKASRASVILLEGHILCEIGIKGATAVVLREHLGTILKRLQKRGYPIKKIRDNLVAEAIDYCWITAKTHYKDIHELMASDRNLLQRLTGLAKGKRQPKQTVDLLPELPSIMRKDRRYII